MKTLTVVVPSYNAAEHLPRCLRTLLDGAAGADDVEVLVVDDGSSDSTAAVAEEHGRSRPGLIRVIRQPNAGHGGAVNTGVDEARGTYLKVIDSDDWVDVGAFRTLLARLRETAASARPVDLVVTNYVYERAGRRRRAAIRYRGALPEGRDVGWEQLGRLRASRHLVMHALTYRTQVLREAGLRLPRHTFYVDNLYAFVPLVQVRTLRYVDVDLYRWFIGREDQSVNESVMLTRIDQQLRVNRLMLEHFAAIRRREDVPERLLRHLEHDLTMICAVSSILLTRRGTDADLAEKQRLWADVATVSEELHDRMRRSPAGRLVTLPGRAGRGLSLVVYRIARRVYGFN